MHKKLFLIHQAVYPDFDGGKKITLGRIMDAVSQGLTVHVIFNNYNSVDTKIMREFFAKSNIRYKEIKSKKSGIKRFFSLFSTKPTYEKFLVTDGMKNVIDKYVKKNTIDIISIETIFFFSAIENIKKSMVIEIVFHNHESIFFWDLATSSFSVYSIFYFLEYFKIKTLEKRIDVFASNQMDTLLVFLTKNDFDEYLSSNLYQSCRHLINDNKIIVPFSINRKIRSVEPFFLFNGSLMFPPNLYAMRWLLSSKIGSSLETKIIVTGAYSQKIKRIMGQYPQIDLAGYVLERELKVFYEECVAVISPITKGSGVKVKNIEAQLLGVDLICTKFSAQGLNVSALTHVVDNNADLFAKIMLEFSTNA